MSTSTMKEEQQKLVDTLKGWQKVEAMSARSASEVIEKTDNDLLQQVMKIIRGDSLRHHEVQQFIIDTFTRQAPSLTPEELAAVWEKVEEHIELERQMIDSVRTALDGVAGKKMVIQEYLLRYLLTDEEKHDAMLDQLNQIKRGMYPYGS